MVHTRLLEARVLGRKGAFCITRKLSEASREWRGAHVAYSCVSALAYTPSLEIVKVAWLPVKLDKRDSDGENPITQFERPCPG